MAPPSGAAADGAGAGVAPVVDGANAAAAPPVLGMSAGMQAAEAHEQVHAGTITEEDFRARLKHVYTQVERRKGSLQHAKVRMSRIAARGGGEGWPIRRD